MKDLNDTKHKIKMPVDPEAQEIAQDFFNDDFHDLSEGKRRVIEKIVEGESIAENTNRVYTEKLTLGQRVSDRIARFGGSWPFIIVAILCLLAWVGLNSYALFGGVPFDPYPFILLNLILSMLAALQAPIIMMSQNRQAEKDRIDAKGNYEVCMKMELEIMRLHQRFDELFDDSCVSDLDGK